MGNEPPKRMLKALCCALVGVALLAATPGAAAYKMDAICVDPARLSSSAAGADPDGAVSAVDPACDAVHQATLTLCRVMGDQPPHLALACADTFVGCPPPDPDEDAKRLPECGVATPWVA